MPFSPSMVSYTFEPGLSGPSAVESATGTILVEPIRFEENLIFKSTLWDFLWWDTEPSEPAPSPQIDTINPTKGFNFMPLIVIGVIGMGVLVLIRT